MAQSSVRTAGQSFGISQMIKGMLGVYDGVLGYTSPQGGLVPMDAEAR